MNIRDKIENELRIKRREARREYKCHYTATTYYKNKHTTYGAIAIVLAAISGSAFIVETTYLVPDIKFMPSLFALLSAMFTGLITFNKYNAIAQKHYDCGSKWEELRDDYSSLLLELTAAGDNVKPEEYIEKLKELSNKRTLLRAETPQYPAKIFRKFEHIKDKGDNDG